MKAKGDFHALFLRGKDKIDFKKLKNIIGKARIASIMDVKEVTGVKPGAVCPLLMPVPVIVDDKVMELNRVNFDSGDHLYGVEMNSMDLERVMEFTVEDIKVG